jgi:hypothetical protein
MENVSVPSDRGTVFERGGERVGKIGFVIDHQSGDLGDKLPDVNRCKTRGIKCQCVVKPEASKNIVSKYIAKNETVP